MEEDLIFDNALLFRTVNGIRTPYNFLQKMQFGRTMYNNTDGVIAYDTKVSQAIAPEVDNVASSVSVENDAVNRVQIEPIRTTFTSSTDAASLIGSVYAGTRANGASGLTSAQAKLSEDVARARQMVDRMIELKCSQILATGMLQGRGSTPTDFDRNSDHTITSLNANDRWNTATANIISQLNTWSTLIENNSGEPPTYLIMGTAAANSLVNRLKEELAAQTATFNLVNFRPRSEGSTGARYLGRLLYPNIDLYSYSAGYRNDSNTFVPFIDRNAVIMGNTGTSTSGNGSAIVYCKIPRADATEPGIFTSYVVDRKTGTASLTTQATVAPYLANPNSTLYAVVQ